jgi:hypothetical protein
MTDRENFEGWAILELMGHRRLTGRVSEVEIAGSSFIRIDVPGFVHTEPTGEQEEREAATQFYSPAAVYCITPTTEEIVRATRTAPMPVQEWELRRALPAGVERDDFLEELPEHYGEFDD